jgi:hypothetical protein
MSNEVTLIVKEAGEVVVLSNVLVGLPGRAGADWSQIQNKPATFPPSTHTHTASQITDFAAAVVAAAPPTTNASLLTSGTLADARLSSTATTALAKATTSSQPGHGHAISEVSGLQEAITAEETARIAADTALGQRIDSAIDSIAEAVTTISTERTERIAADTALDTKITAETTARTTALSTKADLVSGKVPASQLTTFTYGQPGIVPNSFGADAGKFLKGDGNWTLPTTSDVVGLDTALAGKQPTGSYATLDSNNKVPASQIPDLAITDFLGACANQTEMLAKTGQKGDWITRSDDGKVYVITGDSPSNAGSWTALSYPAAPVQSVAGRTGAVTLTKSDVGLDQVANTSDAAKPVSTAQQLALDTKQNLRTTVSFTLQDGDNYLPVSRNTLFLLSGNFTTARINLPTYLPDGSAAWVGDRIRIVWVGAKANANSRINVQAFAGDGAYLSLAQLHNQDQAAEFVLDPIPRNASGQLTWRADVDPIRWVQPPATPSAFVAANGAAYSPSDVAFDGSHFYIYGKKPDGAPVWLRTPMTATW